MTGKWKRARRYALVCLALVLVAAAVLLETGLAERWARGAIVARLERLTGGRVELRAFHFSLRGLRAQLDDLTIRGLEPAGTPPLFHADQLRIGLRPSALLGRIALDEMDLERPAVHLRMEKDGRTNLPSPKQRRASAKPWRERLFEMEIGRLEVRDGSVTFNDVRAPLETEGGQFRFTMDRYAPAPGKESYRGTLAWQGMQLAARRYLPFRSDLGAKFTLTRSGFELDQFRWKLPHSEVEARAELASFQKREWDFHYRVRLDLDDVREILRKPNTPAGAVESTGEGRYAGGQFELRGHYTAHNITMPYKWFHSRGMESRGSIAATGHTLEVPNFQAWALGGEVNGRVDLDFHGLAFRVTSHARGMNLSSLLAAVDNPSFPMHTLHWAGSVDVDSVTTWNADFKHVASRGTSIWSPPATVPAGEIPTTARLNYDYRMNERAVAVHQSEISTPTSHIEFDGRLGADDSKLAAQVNSQDLKVWDDFINYLRGAEAEPRRIAGRALWAGKMSGPLARPTFAGHVHAFEAQYDRLYWDEIDGEMGYSPEQFRLERTRARRGHSSATLTLWLELDDWSFLPENHWSLSVQLAGAETDELQALLGTAFPVHGLVTGQFQCGGTREDPELHGTFDVASVDAWGYQVDRVRGQLDLRHDELRIASAEIAKGQSRVTGSFSYERTRQEVSFDIAATAIPLEEIKPIQTPQLPLGGRVDFTLRGQGVLPALVSAGSVHLANLRVGNEVLGSFTGQLAADGRRVHLDVNSTMNTGQARGQFDLTLGGEYPLRGELTVEAVDLDPFIQTGLRLRQLTGHSRVSGQFAIAGFLAEPETIAVQANLSHVSLDYEFVKLENVGPVRFGYRRDEIRIEEAELRGQNTDLTLSGLIRFDANRPLDLRLAGSVNLRLAQGLLPALEARGGAQVNAQIEGTFSSPHITGRAHVENAAASYGDFPASVSQLTGDFLFDRSRLLFENVTAAAGGGTLVLSGSMSYGEGPLHYEVAAQARNVRIRYPEGMSWLGGGNLRLAGTMQAAQLSGRVVVHRLLMTRGFNVTSILIATKEPIAAPATTSPFLRNLQFDIEAVSSPDARVEWEGARLEVEGNLRVRGTWEHPVFLGNIHLVSGEMSFRGNRYRLTRGDINFANPFRLDPVLNLEATTTIQQYEVTLDFTGPASRPSLSYRSDPPLPESDVIALLALGRTGQESELRTATGGQASESGASMVLSEAISSQVGGRLERLFGTRLQFDPFLAGTSTDPNAGTRVTVQQQVAHDLTITYSTNTTTSQTQVIQIEYAVSRELSVVALRDVNGTFGLDFKFKKHFK